MIFWIIVVILLLLAVAAVVWPLVQGRHDVRDEADFDIEVFRDQLAEISRELAEGRLDYAEAEAAKAEISRRILAADGARKRAAVATRGQPAAAGVLAALLVGSTIVVYLQVGAPNQLSRPFAEREEERQQRVAEQQGGRMDLAAVAERLKKRLERNSENPQGWQLLARTYMTMGNFKSAAPAYARLIELKPAIDGVYAAYGEALVLSANGSVTPKSLEAFRKALDRDAKEPTARFYMALASWQTGEHREAYDAWFALLAESSSDAPWAFVTRQRLEEASEKLCLDLAALPQPFSTRPPKPEQGLNGPSQEEVDAAQQMSPDDRHNMLRGMVAGLAEKLDENPDNFEGWLRLIRSYSVLGEAKKAKKAFDNAMAQFANAPFVKSQLQALAGEIGLVEAASASPRGPSTEDIHAAQDMSVEDRREMIAGMVERLAAKLKENPSDLQGWVRLARSYNVLGKPEDARDAMAKASAVAPENIDILTLYARSIRAASGKKPTTESVEVMQKLLKLAPTNVEALFFVGLAAAGAGDSAEARRLWQKAQAGVSNGSAEHKALQRQIDGLPK